MGMSRDSRKSAEPDLEVDALLPCCSPCRVSDAKKEVTVESSRTDLADAGAGASSNEGRSSGHIKGIVSVSTRADNIDHPFVVSVREFHGNSFRARPLGVGRNHFWLTVNASESQDRQPRAKLGRRCSARRANVFDRICQMG